jgi:hypothetical protein
MTHSTNVVLSTVFDTFRHEFWNVGIVHEPISAFLSGRGHNIQWLPKPETGTHLADPFAIIRDDRAYIFCEEFRSWNCTQNPKGRIVCIELADALPPSRPKPVIELAVHASYPYLLQHESEIYCIPETGSAREIGLYKAKAFPFHWSKVANLVSDFPGVDSSVFEHQGRWWLTCATREAGDNLFIWHSTDLYGPWEAHAANPVKTDISSSRPAGTPFMHDGFLFRPAQDCSRTYGGRVIINRVTKLTTTEFAEEPAAVVEASREWPYPDGTHTLSAAGNWTVIDGRRFIFDRSRFSYFYFKHALEVTMSGMRRRLDSHI